jgi:hypothetical protein
MKLKMDHTVDGGRYIAINKKAISILVIISRGALVRIASVSSDTTIEKATQ